MAPSQALEGVLAEDDRDLERWYLLGLAREGAGDGEGAAEALAHAQAAFAKMRAVHISQPGGGANAEDESAGRG